MVPGLSRSQLKYVDNDAVGVIQEIFQLDSLYEMRRGPSTSSGSDRVMRCALMVDGNVIGCADQVDADLLAEIEAIVEQHADVSLQSGVAPLHVRLNLIEADDAAIEIHLQPAGGWSIKSATLMVNDVALTTRKRSPWQWNEKREVAELSNLARDEVLDLRVVVEFGNGEVEEVTRRTMYG